jgi:hypothetical protein
MAVESCIASFAVLILQLDSHERYNIWCLPLQRAVREPYHLMIAPSVQSSWRSHILEQVSIFRNGSWTLTSKAKKKNCSLISEIKNRVKEIAKVQSVEQNGQLATETS